MESAVGSVMDTQLAYPAVEFVGEEATKEHSLPVELNDEPFMLVEWASDSSRRRAGHQYSFPPGIALLALVAPAALLFFLMKKYGLLERKPEPAPDGGVYGITELEDAISAPSEISSFAQRSAALQSVLERVSSDVEGAQKETDEKKGAALAVVKGLSGEFERTYAGTIKTLEELTGTLTKLSESLLNASQAMRGPLSDSQSVIAFSTVEEQLRLELVKMPAERIFVGNFDDVERALQAAGMASAQDEKSGIQKLGDWLVALRRQHRLLLDSASVVLTTAAEWRKDLDALH